MTWAAPTGVYDHILGHVEVVRGCDNCLMRFVAIGNSHSGD